MKAILIIVFVLCGYRLRYEVWNKSDLCTAADGRTAHLAAGTAGDGPQALLQSFRYVYGIQIPFCFWHMHTPIFISSSYLFFFTVSKNNWWIRSSSSSSG